MNNDNELLDLYEERVNKYIDEKRKTDDLFDYIDRLEERIDKAIEFIYVNAYDEERKNCIDDLWNEIPELLDILKGSDKE